MRRILTIGAVLTTLVVVVAFVLSWSFYRQALKTVENSVGNEMRIMAGQTAKSIEELVADYQMELRWMAETISKDDLSGEEKFRFLLTEQQDNRFMHLIFTLDQAGVCDTIVPAGVLDGVLGKDFSSRRYFQQARDTGTPVISGLIDAGKFNDVANKFKAFVVAAPIFDNEGRFRGVVGTDIMVQAIAQRYVLPLTFGRNGYAWMLDGTGTTLAHHDFDKIGINLAENVQVPHLAEHVRDHMLQGESGVFRYALGGDKIAAYAPARVGPHVWPVVITVPYEDVERLVYPIYNRLMLVMCFVVLVITSGGLFIIRKHMEVKRLQEKVVALEIRIDEEKKAQEVSQITESDYFQDLLKKADELRG